MKCSKCGVSHEVYRDRAHKTPSSYCNACNAEAMRLRRAYMRSWVQQQHGGTKIKATRPCPEACEVCGAAPAPGKRLDFDHCHQRGAFRGWLCRSCNLALGHAKDDPERLRRLASYLLDFSLLGLP